MSIEFGIIFLLLGCFVGFMSGLLGIGGGGILVPALTSIFIAIHLPHHLVMHLALGTSMACIIITSLSSLRAHHTRNGVDWATVKVMTPGVVIGTFLATFFASNLSTQILAAFFSVFMAYVAIQMFVDHAPNNSNKSACIIELGGVSCAIGIISALVSIGGGSLTVPYLYWRNFEIKKAIGTSAALGLPIALSGSAGYLINGLAVNTSLPYSLGFVYLPAVLLISITSFATAPLGAKLAHTLPVKTIKRVFAILLVLLSLKMLYMTY